MKIKKVLKEVFNSDYRHYICAAISLVFLGCGFLFPNAIPRLGEALRDLATSIGYYFCEIFAPDANPIRPTVLSMPEWKWAESIWKPLELFPWTWEEFQVLWGEYWKAWASKENLIAYFYWLGDVMYYASRFLLVFIPIGALLWFKLRSYTRNAPSKRKGNSRPLQLFESFLFKAVYPVIAWLKDFVTFLRENKRYYQLWLMLWVLYFNLASITVAFFAYYFYFSVTFDVPGLYTQFLKLLSDLTPMIRFLPGVVWLVIGGIIYNYVCRSMAFTRLYHYERSNRDFLKKRGVVTTVYGNMGTGKTQLITSMAISAEIEQWDQAFEILLEKDLMFPNFKWQNLRDYLRREIEDRKLCDLDAVRARFDTYKKGYNFILRKGFTPEGWQAYRKAKKLPDYTFGYDFEHYSSTYNDELKITHIMDAVSDYACAYLVFTVRTSLIFSNYSIRVDSMIKDLGNMPLRDNDFLKRDVKWQKAYSRQCHIINYDMLRLGKRMQREFKLSFGVYVITEIDKERKNSLELKEVKRSEDECNQNNDLFNACLMMCRHAAVISNRVFIRIICDLQRPEAWGAGGRELGEVIYISEKCELYPALPFFAPYWLVEWIFSKVKDKWADFHEEYIHRRRDGTLFAYLFTNTVSKINNHYDKVRGLFGTFALKLELQSGRLEGDVKCETWHIITKKDRSARYKTDCLSTVFETYEPNTMHIDDFICYAGSFGTLKENGLQKSFFQNDLRRMHEEAA